MNRFAALDIEEYDEPPDIVEREEALRQEVTEARRVMGNNPFLESLYPMTDEHNWGAVAPVEQFDLWKTEHGDLIPVREMGDEHLLNAARKIMRQLDSKHPAAEFKKKFRQRWLKALKKEANRRGRLL